MLDSIFHPDAPARNNRLFGLPCKLHESLIAVIPVAWEGTASFRKGTAKAPDLIREVSGQIDLCDPAIEKVWEIPIYMGRTKKTWMKLFKESSGRHTARVNAISSQLNRWIEKKTKSYLQAGKIPALLGGEHSIATGLIRACAGKFDNFGILHLDAHADLRQGYEGYVFSHASVMHHALRLPQLGKLIQVGIRDFCHAEQQIIRNDNRIRTFFMQYMNRELFAGKNWALLCDEIISELPEKVYVSFDVDCLDVAYCRSTGTPVPGGLSYNQSVFLLHHLVQSGRKIIGFDLSETGTDPTDALTSAHLLFALCKLSAVSQGFGRK